MKICQNCNQSFSITQVIDGTRRNLCKRKYCLDCSPWNQHNTTSPRVRNVIKGFRFCRTCDAQKPLNEFYGKRSYCKLCDKKRVLELSQWRKRKLLEMFGGKCACCGYNRYVGALEFHHRDPNTKTFNIAKITQYPWKDVVVEATKCLILCSNCHKEFHAGLVDLPSFALG